MPLQQTAWQNIVTKGEIAQNKRREFYSKMVFSMVVPILAYSVWYNNSFSQTGVEWLCKEDLLKQNEIRLLPLLYCIKGRCFISCHSLTIKYRRLYWTKSWSDIQKVSSIKFVRHNMCLFILGLNDIPPFLVRQELLSRFPDISVNLRKEVVYYFRLYSKD